VKRGDARDEVTAIRQVHAMRTGLDAGARNRVAASLERPDRIHDDRGSESREALREIRRGAIEDGWLCISPTRAT
jgi:hypothetical protein